MNIKLINYENGVNKFTEELDPMSHVLRNRGVTDIEGFFNLGWDDVQSSYDLDNIQLAADKILYHCRNSKTIAVLVDCDADGMTSAAVLINYLEEQRRMGFVGENNTWDGNTPEFQYLLHEKKEHGLTDTIIMKQLRDLVKPALLIVPDASGTDEQYKALNDLGIDIVVLDHHDTKEKGDNNKTIVVNNQHSEKYRNKDLSGVGVVYQLCRVFDDMLSFVTADKWLDLVAVGLVADVMDMRSPETRFLVLEGLKPENIRSPFLRQARIDLSYSLGGEYNPLNVAFYIGPLFNAVLRIGTMEEKTLLFRSLLDADALSEIENGKRGCKGEMVELVVETLRQSTNAKGRQKRRQDKLTELIDAVISEEGLLQNKVLMLAIDDFEEDQRALSGLIANKIQDYYQRPCILMFQNEDGSYSGSVRAPDNIEAFAGFRDQCNDSKLVVYASGHAQAFGIKVTAANVQALQNHFNKKYADIVVDATYNCDFCFDASDPKLGETIEALAAGKEVWGTGIKEPLIAVTNVHISRSSLTLMSADKNPTLKIDLPVGVECLRFRSSKEEFDSLCLPYDGVEQYYEGVIVGKCSINEWRGKCTPQLFIENYEVGDVKYEF